MMESPDTTSADYIIVGAGIAGCTLAARLRERIPFASILLIEAGSDPSDDPQAQSAAGFYLVRLSDLAWHLNVAANPHLGGRSFIADVGKALGGGGAINAGAWTRGKVDSMRFDFLPLTWI
jgi:choline dehydrogenase-like flavoprotein